MFMLYTIIDRTPPPQYETASKVITGALNELNDNDPGERIQINGLCLCGYFHTRNFYYQILSHTF